MQAILVMILASMLAACVTTELTQDAKSVRITSNADVVHECSYLGEAKASDRLNGGLLGQGAAEENTDRKLKNAAAEKGGNVVLLGDSRADFTGASARGEIYRCK